MRVNAQLKIHVQRGTVSWITIAGITIAGICSVVSAGGPSSWLFGCRVGKLHPMGVQDWLVLIRDLLLAVCMYHLSSDEGEGNPVHGLSRCRGSLCLYYIVLLPVALRLFSSISSPCLFLQPRHSSHIILYENPAAWDHANGCMSTRPVPVINHSISDTAREVKVTAVNRPSIHESHGMGYLLMLEFLTPDQGTLDSTCHLLVACRIGCNMQGLSGSCPPRFLNSERMKPRFFVSRKRWEATSTSWFCAVCTGCLNCFRATIP